uniref:Fcf2 pre-rRNA processing C-terminal domain-containing protein n=1 Tax=Timema poppense TaxID=170557 RepID=A0A7R9D116_TIMPO|nr:unnamed protein product [Timema poppensis]
MSPWKELHALIGIKLRAYVFYQTSRSVSNPTPLVHQFNLYKNTWVRRAETQFQSCIQRLTSPAFVQTVQQPRRYRGHGDGAVRLTGQTEKLNEPDYYATEIKLENAYESIVQSSIDLDKTSNSPSNDTSGNANVDSLESDKDVPEVNDVNSDVELDDVESESDTFASFTEGLEFTNDLTTKKTRQSSRDEDFDFNDVYVDMVSFSRRRITAPTKLVKSTLVDDVLKKSVITPGFEKLYTIPLPEENKKKLKKIRQQARERTKGEGWFNMPATEMTDELKHDLEVLQMRSVLDPKHFYKKNDLKVLPKFFQVGRVVEAPADYYHSRVPMKQRKKTIVEELMADAEFQKYNKKRYKEIIEQRRKTHFKAHKQAKKLKRKKK